ncbi:proline-rich extensin-like protein EPR1 [Helianthus annuus]|uniref:proline-rich extensin-like protein EPR1 n=1 Tax=Helianthus annuus TaxID=4232 RepID=UPI000B8EF38A|nr:proline-rich extensin-like protein EPR1 [Helianthus annuus]
MNPLENQSTPQQQTPQQPPITEMPPMPPPPFTFEPQQQTPPIAPSSRTTTQPTSAPTGEFHVIGGPLYSLESQLPSQPNPLRPVNQPNLVPYPNRSGAMFEQVENRARTETWDDGYGDEEWGINEGYMGYPSGFQNPAFNRNQPMYQQ